MTYIYIPFIPVAVVHIDDQDFGIFIPLRPTSALQGRDFINCIM